MNAIRRHTSLAVVLVLAALVGSLALGTRAGAASPDAQAWWYIARSSQLPIATPVPPTVDDEGLYVAAGPNGALAVAALRARVGDVSRTEIALEITDSSGDVVIGACRTSAWFPVQAGNWDERPDPDCEAGSVAGVVSEDGGEITFDVSALVEGGAIDVMLLPGTAEGDTPVSFSASIAPPGESTITVTEAPPPVAPPTTVAVDPAPTGAPPTSAASPPVTFSPADGVTTSPLPETAIEVPPITPTEDAAPTGQPVTPLPVSADARSEEDEGRLLGIGIIVLLAIAYVVLQGRDGHAPVPLTVAARTDTATAAGIGRFTKERSGRPPPLW